MSADIKKIASGLRGVLVLSDPNGGARNIGSYVTGVDLFDGLTHEALKVLGLLRTAQQVPVDYNASLRANHVYLIGDSATKMGIFPEMGETDDDFLDNVLNLPDMTAVLRDPASVANAQAGWIIVEGVRTGTRSKSLVPGQLVYESIDFVATKIRELGDAFFKAA